MKRSLLLAGIWAVAAWVFAQQHPNLDRGFDPNKVYQLGDVDSIDLYNGHLTLRIPIGPKYPVSERFSYGLTLSYNSNIWAFEQWPAGTGSCVAAEPKRSFEFDWNVGVGFLLGLGDLRYRSNLDDWVYLSPDGAEHVFSQTYPGFETSEPANYVYYTQDGTYLRLTWYPGVSPRLAVIEFPDGNRHTFSEYQSGKYRLIKMTDSVKTGSTYPNWVTVSYLSAPDRIVLTDRFGRSQSIYLSTDTTAVPATFVSSVVLTAFGGTTLRYQFTYEKQQILRSCKANCDAYGLQPRTVNARFLKSVVAYDASNQELERWEFPEYHWLTQSCTVDYGGGPRVVKDAPGILRKYVLPTRGQVLLEWDEKVYYDRTEWPKCGPAQNPENCLPHIAYQTAASVSKKRIADPFAAVPNDSFTYRFYTHDTWYNKNGTIYEFADELVTVVRDPNGNEVAHFFAPGVDAQGKENQWYGGLPFTRLQGDGTDRKLSRKSFRGSVVVDCSGSFCAVGPAQGAQLLRAEFSVYETQGDTPDKGNRRLRHNRNYFADDPVGCAVQYPLPGTTNACAFSGVARQDWDGYGHYRQETTEGQFPGETNAIQRTSYTNYNPGVGFPWSLPSWILNTFDYRRMEENGEFQYEYACFQPSTGLLLRKRVLTSLSGALRSNDLVTVYSYDTSGNLVSEAFYGGDTQAQISTDPNSDLCSLALPALPVYRQDHQVQYGVRKRSAWIDPSTNQEILVTADLDPDPSTGLPAVSRDSSGMATQYLYDALGRVTWVRPQPGPGGQPGGGGWTQVEYAAATATTMAKVRVSTCVANTTNCAAMSAPLARQTYFYDGFGRLRYHYRLIPQETSYLAFRRFDYNALGWKTFESEWHRGDETITSGTTWSYDPLGRPLTVTTADGKSTSFAYTGVRVTSRTFSVATSLVGESLVTTTEEYDRHGRLVKVVEPSGPNGAMVDTSYTYNVLGKVSRAQTPAASPIQIRQWTYDGRGFLTGERLPEKGSAGNGWVSYQGFDPLGNATRVIDGPNDLNFIFDRAGRLVTVKETASGRTLKQFTYATANSGSDMSRGKLIQAVANNYFDPANPSANFQVVESFKYEGTGGKVSQKTTTVGVVGGYTGTFTQNFGWNDLWELAWQSYPSGMGIPSRTISYDYDSGFLQAVREGSQVHLTLVYHPNGMVAKRVRGNGTTDVVARDGNRMARPASIEVRNSSGSVLWGTGTYGYDGAGNIRAMGADRFAYDGVVRLVQASLQGQSFAARYNAFGFLTGMAKNGAWQTFAEAASGGTNRISGASYDAAGQMLAWGGRSFSWYPTGSMRQMSMSGYSATYGYDARDERVAWVDSAEPGIHYTLRGLGNEILREVHELNGSWSLRKDYLYAGKEHIATIDGAGVKHVHKDHLGSTRLVTSAAGSVLSQHNYWPFGEEMTVTSSPERMRFAGHERDALSSLDYMHARFYAPWGGRFLSVDPGRDDDFHKPQSFNLYAYVRNNPLNAVDRNGRAAFPALLVGPVVGAVAGGAAHLVVNRVILGKSWGDSFRGIHRSMAVGALGGVGKAGPLLAGVGAGFNAFKDARTRGLTTEKALERAVEIGAITLLGGSVGSGVAAGLGAAPGSVPSEFAVAAGAAAASEAATYAMAGAEALRQELQPWAQDSSRNLADQNKQLEELKKQEEEAAKRLVKGTDRTNPATGEEER